MSEAPASNATAPAATTPGTTEATTAAAPAPVTAAATPAVTPEAAAVVQATEAKPEGATEAKPAEVKQPEGAPEKYEPFKAPEGVSLDTKVTGELATVAKELNLSQTQAQALVDRMAPVVAAQNAESINAVLVKADAEWQAARVADPEIGGAQADERAAVAKATFQKFGTPELAQLLTDSRLGNHPELVRWAYRVGKAISPDSNHVTGSEAQPTKSIAQRLYPDMK